MSQNRQLAAIMFTDIEGYTALMQQNEENAIKFRDTHRKIFDASTIKFNGTIVQYFGDGTLSVFKSSVEAVKSAIEMQLAFIEEELPVRIGIHVGDIVYTDDDIIGDAVNIAARIESCAVSGSVLISDKVHDQIRSHPQIESKFLDDYPLKNVDPSMPIYAIANEGLVIPDPDKVKGKFKDVQKKDNNSIPKKKAIGLVLATLALILVCYFVYDSLIKPKPDRELSIAVLPFDNLSTDEDSEIFRDGMTEDILTYLSKIKDLRVISRTSVMRYKETKKSIPEIAKELGVTHILEGSIRKYGDQIRVTAQLIDPEDDNHLWSENYDRTITDIFKIQSEVSREIVQALEVNLSAEEEEGLEEVTEYNIEAYKLFLQGRQEADKRNIESIKKSIELYKQVIEIEPQYAEAFAEIANSTYLQTYYGGVDHIEAAKVAREYLDKAQAIDNRISRIYSVRGLIYNIEGKMDEAKAEFAKALTLSPNDLTARHQFATLHYYTKEYEKQLEQAEIAYRLDPLSFATANSYFTALLTNLKYDEAEALLKKIEEESDDNNQFVIHRSYFRLYMDKRDYKKAIGHLEEIVEEGPIFNRFLGYCYAKVGDTAGAYRMIADIRKRTPQEFKSHQLAVVYSGLQDVDSTLFHLDTIRNKQSGLFARDRGTFFEFINEDQRFLDLLQAHGISQ